MAPWGPAGQVEPMRMHPEIVLFIFLMSIYGLSNAIAVLKVGQFIFGIGHCREKNCTAPGHPKELRQFLGRIPYIGDLFYCPPCLAFWFGMGFSVAIESPASFLTDIRWLSMVIDGLLASGGTWLLHLTAERLGHQLDL